MNQGVNGQANAGNRGQASRSVFLNNGQINGLSRAAGSVAGDRNADANGSLPMGQNPYAGNNSRRWNGQRNVSCYLFFCFSFLRLIIFCLFVSV